MSHFGQAGNYTRWTEKQCRDTLEMRGRKGEEKRQMRRKRRKVLRVRERTASCVGKDPITLQPGQAHVFGEQYCCNKYWPRKDCVTHLADRQHEANYLEANIYYNVLVNKNRKSNWGIKTIVLFGWGGNNFNFIYNCCEREKKKKKKHQGHQHQGIHQVFNCN